MNLHDTVDCQYLDSELKEYALCDFLTQESAEKVKDFCSDPARLSYDTTRQS